MRIKRKPKQRGDLPDWLASDSTLSQLFIAEAKGCHDKSGADQALGRAWLQANRIDVFSRGKKASVKRIAIATRWGVTSGGPNHPIMAVRDPDEIGDMTQEQTNAALVGIVRHHTLNLLRGTGHEGLAQTLRDLIEAPTARLAQAAQQDALGALAAADSQPPRVAPTVGPADTLIGGWVTRAGLAREPALSLFDQQVLVRLDLRPVFVGAEKSFVKGVIRGDLEVIRSRTRERVTVGTARTNGTGVWMLRPAVTDADQF